MQEQLEALEQEIANVEEEIKNNAQLFTQAVQTNSIDAERLQRYLVYCGGRRDGLMSALEILTARQQP